MCQNISAYLQEAESKRWDLETTEGINPDDREDTQGICKHCDMAITYNADLTDWESSDERCCQQVGSTITVFYQQHEPA
jgi:hypothetical protein